MPGSFMAISTWLKIALVCLSLGVLLFVVGFATDSWVTYPSRYGFDDARGLWAFKTCTASYCTSTKYNSYNLPDFHKATQAMECIGLIALLLAFLLLLLYCFVSGCHRREALLGTIFFIFGAVVAMVIGYIIFGTKYENRDIGWSMGVAIAGTVLTFVAGVMCVLQIMGR